MVTATVSDLRVLFVDDDPALREMLTARLERLSMVQTVTPLGSPRDALRTLARTVVGVDLALLDFDLGPGRINGVDLGLALRALRPGLPIIVLSQHAQPRIATLVPVKERRHWAFAQKSATLDVAGFEDLVDRTVAGGEAVVGDVEGAATSTLDRLSRRQRQVMALAAAGYDAKGIAERLPISHVSVRSELSKAYRVLVPEPEEGTDLRTLAVLEYIRLSADSADLTTRP